MLLLSAQEVSDIIENAVQRGVTRALQAKENLTVKREKLSTREVCEEFGVSRATLFRWSKQGYLKPHKERGLRPYYLRSEVEEVI